MSTEKFEPENYTDEARHHMLELIEQKVKGGDIVVAHEQNEEATKIAARKLERRKVQQ